MRREELEKLLMEVKIAKKVLCDLYPEAGGHNTPRHAGIVLRRFFQRERDLMGFLEVVDEPLPEKLAEISRWVRREYEGGIP